MHVYPEVDVFRFGAYARRCEWFGMRVGTSTRACSTPTPICGHSLAAENMARPGKIKISPLVQFVQPGCLPTIPGIITSNSYFQLFFFAKTRSKRSGCARGQTIFELGTQWHNPKSHVAVSTLSFPSTVIAVVIELRDESMLVVR